MAMPPFRVFMEVVLMTTYEEFMIIFAICMLFVAILNIKNK